MSPQPPTASPGDSVSQCNPEDDVSKAEATTEKDQQTSLDELLATTQIQAAALKFGWDAVLKRVLEAGIAYRDEQNNTVLHHAFLGHAPDAITDTLVSNYLKKGIEILVNAEGLSYLHIASARSKLEHVQQFLTRTDVEVDFQVHMNAKSAYVGFTALHFAVQFGKTDVVACLLSHDASISVQNANGTTPLHLACYSRNIDMIDLMLEHDRDSVNVVDKFNTSHFMAACMSTNSNFAKQYLILAYHRHNVPPIALVSQECDMRSYPNYIPLHFAAEFGRLETVKLLLAYGANCCASTSTNETPFTLAQKHSHIEVCRVLKQHCENYRAWLSDREKTLAQSQDTREFSSSKEPEINLPIDNSNSSRDYASPDTTLNCVTSNRLHDSNDKVQIYNLVGCEDYGIYLYDD